MLLEKIDLKKNKVLKISTIIIYVIAILSNNINYNS